MSDSKNWMPGLLAVAAAMTALVTTAARPSPVLCAGDWKKVANSGPPRRSTHAMAYDWLRRRVVLFGGVDEVNTRLGDTWEWDGSTWSQVASDGPSPRAYSSAAFDGERGKVVLFGGAGKGNDSNADNDDTWEWDGAVWQDASDTNKRPVARNGMGMAYDVVRQKVVLYGGGIVFGPRLDDTWTRGPDWRRRPLAGGPGERILYHGMAFDRELGVAVQYSATESCTDGSTWTWNGDTWTQATGAQPGVRFGTALAYDSARHRTVLYGGYDCAGSGPSDTWEWDGVDWQQVATTGPGPRFGGPSLAYDREVGKVVMFGGAVPGHNATGDTWTWLGPTYRCDVPIEGDINCDGIVDIDDGRIIVAGRGHPACAADDTRDLDGDGRITYADKHLLDALCTFPACARKDGTVDD